MRRIATRAVLGLALTGGAFLAANTAAGRYEQQLEASEALSDQLDASRDAYAERVMLKDLVASEYLGRHATFSQVVDQFQRLNAADGRIAETIRTAYPAADDREAAARNAVNFIVAGVARDASRRAGVLAELRAEFARLFPVAGTAF